MRESYEKGDLIREHVKQLESQEDTKNQKKLDEKLDSFFYRKYIFLNNYKFIIVHFYYL